MFNRIVSQLFVVFVVMFVPNTASAALFQTASLIEEGEQFANDPMFDSVGWLRGIDCAGDGFVGGSGVLIHPEWVLTATHVTFQNGGQTPFAEMSFSLSNSIFNGSPNFVDVDQWYTFPGYRINPGSGHDIALVHLVDPIFNVIPAERYRGTGELGMQVSAAGYGEPGAWPNPGSFDGVQRAGENVINRIGWPLIAIDDQYLLADYGPARSTPTLPLEWASSSGDSGGGWFADIDGTIQLVGITNFSRGNSTLSGATRVSLYNDWIDSHITSVPEPSSLLLLSLVGSITLLVTRLRKSYADC